MPKRKVCDAHFLHMLDCYVTIMLEQMKSTFQRMLLLYFFHQRIAIETDYAIQITPNTGCSSNQTILSRDAPWLSLVIVWFGHGGHRQWNDKYKHVQWIEQWNGTIISVALIDWLQNNTRVTKFSVQGKVMNHLRSYLWFS